MRSLAVTKEEKKDMDDLFMVSICKNKGCVFFIFERYLAYLLTDRKWEYKKSTVMFGDGASSQFYLSGYSRMK